MSERENSGEVAALWIISVFFISAAIGSLLGYTDSGATTGIFIGVVGALFIAIVNHFNWGQPTIFLVNRFLKRVLVPLMLFSLAYLMFSNLLSYFK